MARAPERIVLVVIALSIAAGLAVTVGAHHWWLVLPLAAGILALTWQPLAPTIAPTVADARAGLIAVVGTGAWTVVNILMGAEYLLVVRDPGFLTLSGMWLVDHGSTDIPVWGADVAAQAGSQAIADASEAWNLKGDVIQPQGAKMLPATIAIGGWIAGDSGVLAANVVIGAAGILAVYVLGRRFLSPYAALAPAGALALTVAHIGLSRPAYTEPLTLLLVIAGILWTWRGIERSSPALMAAGGAVSGATMLVRIDGTAYAIGACIGVIAALFLAQLSGLRRLWLGTAFLGSQVLFAVIGYASLARWSTEYLERLGTQSTLVNAAYLAGCLACLALLAIAAAPRTDATIARALEAMRTTRGGHLFGLWLAVAVSGALTVLASRPLWTTTRRGTDTESEQFANGVTESFQAAQGLPIDPTRNYAESTVTWLSYHLTWPLVALGILGFGIAAYKAVRGRAAWAVFLGTALAPSLLYFVRPSIIPDQIWAIRRFEPVTIPAFVLAAALAAWALASLLRGAKARRMARRTAAVSMLALPVTTWLAPTPGEEYPVSTAVNVTTREMIGARSMLDALCALEPGRPIILVRSSELFGGLRVTCDVPVVLALTTQEAEDMAAMAAQFDTAPLVLSRSEDSVPWTDTPAVVVDSAVTHSGYSLTDVPRGVYTREYQWLAGIVTEDGTVAPLSGTTAHEVTGSD
ncbi:hypothetical protein [Demequina sp.]|uniref:hypothetical protein n=1 Tax=Demequina sp. TaxID=2050685 RepID=UPI003A88CCC2